MVTGRQLDVYAAAADLIQRRLRDDMAGRALFASYGSKATRRVVQKYFEECRESLPLMRDFWKT